MRNLGKAEKCASPAEDWERQFLRIVLGIYKNGKHHCFIEIGDEHDEVVLISQHAVLINNAEI
jgi:hypothetical protein